jgi:zinc/manganese transport system permease protein
LLVGGVVLGIGTMGLMATFAMLFIPPWVAFRLVRGWTAALLFSALLGLSAMLAGLRGGAGASTCPSGRRWWRCC